MAAVTHRVATASTSNTSSYASGAFTPAVGDLLVVFVHVTASVAAAPTMSTTGAAQSYSLATTKAVKASSADTLYCFVSNNFVTAASSQTVTFATSDAATSCFIQVFSVSGMSKSGLYAVRQMAKQDNGSAASAPTVTFPGVCLTGNVVAGAVANATSPAGLTPPASFTEGNDSTGVSTPTTGQEYAYRDSGHTSATVTWASNSASAFCALAVELDASAPAKTATLVDAFETGSLDAQWTNGGAATVSSGALHLPGIGYGTTYAVNSVADYDLTSSELVVEVSGVPGTHLVDGPFLTLELYYGNTPAPTNYYLRWFLYLSGSSEWSMAYKNTGTEVAVGSNQALGSGNRWLRIKHDGTNILWDTSPDGTTWSNRGSIAKATVGIPFSNLKVSMRAGADPSNSGNFDIGNVNTLGSTTHNAVAALAVTSTHVAAAEAVHEALAARSVTATQASAGVAVHEGLAARAVTATLAAAATVTEAVHDAVAALAVTATRAAAAVAVHEASAALSITATSTAAATRTTDAVGSLAVTGTLASTAGRTQEAAGSLALTSAGAATATRSTDATGALAVSATQQAAAFIERNAVSSLSVSATGAAAGVVIHEALSALAVISVAASAAARDVPASASLTVAESGTSAADHVAEAVAALVATMFADAAAEGVEGELEAQGDLDVTAALSASASRTVAADAARAVSAALVAAATRTVPAAGALSATATSSAAATATHAASASLSVTATRVAGAEKTGQQDAQAALSAAATLSATAAVTRPATGTLTGTAALSGAAERGRNTSAVGAVSAALTAEAEVVRAAEAVLAVTALELASAGRNVTAESALDVTADLAAGASSIRPDIEVDLSVPVEDHGILVPVGAGSATMVLNRRETTVSVGTREV